MGRFVPRQAVRFDGDVQRQPARKGDAVRVRYPDMVGRCHRPAIATDARWGESRLHCASIA
jgi:hypothetical protein